jgi:hypothetical protein
MNVVKSKSILIATIFVIATLWAGETLVAANHVQSQKRQQGNTGTPQKKISKRIEFENAALKMIVIPRTREQMKAFYEGRGFPASAIAAVGEACFMTVIVKNKTKDILWLELNNWRFANESERVKRLDRPYWKQRWEALQTPMASRSTFGWTLLPEQRDLRPDEGVGGNITLAFTTVPFELEARFYQGKDKHSGPVTVHLTSVQCTR